MARGWTERDDRGRVWLCWYEPMRPSWELAGCIYTCRDHRLGEAAPALVADDTYAQDCVAYIGAHGRALLDERARLTAELRSLAESANRVTWCVVYEDNAGAEALQNLIDKLKPYGLAKPDSGASGV